jgi:CheY-like chemotaxis protein
MTAHKELPVVVIADDNPGDRMLAVTALRKSRLNNPIQEVADGEELMDYLLQRGKYAQGPKLRRPLVILLDLNMPKKSGLEALAEIKANTDLRRIPVIILTTSESELDIVRAYDLGVNSFITKPVNFDDFLATMKQVGEYWLELVSVPDGHEGGNG